MFIECLFVMQLPRTFFSPPIQGMCQGILWVGRCYYGNQNINMLVKSSTQQAVHDAIEGKLLICKLKKSSTPKTPTMLTILTMMLVHCVDLTCDNGGIFI